MPAMALAAALLAFSMVSYKKNGRKKGFRTFKKLFNITFKSVKTPASCRENVRNPDRLYFENILDFQTRSDIRTGSDIQTGSDYR